MGKGEMFYVDENGKKQDAELHEEILNNPEADKYFRKLVIEQARRDGMSEEAIKLLYGVSNE